MVSFMNRALNLYEQQEEWFVINLCHPMTPVNYNQRSPDPALIQIYNLILTNGKCISSKY